MQTNFVTKESFTENDLDILRGLGFITSTGSPYYDFDETFSIVLNPCNCSHDVVICSLTETNPKDEYTYPLFDVYRITMVLIENGLIMLDN